MNRSLATILLLTLALLAVSAWACYLSISATGDGRESFRDKHEWAILQSIEAINRGTAIPSIEFRQSEGCRVVCLPALNGERIWIMLNPQSAPYYKQLPPGNYALSKAQFAQIAAQRPISTVEECLSSHVLPER
jgi:hypothetical protein